MAMRIQEILTCLDEAHLHYELHEITREPVILFQTNNYMGDNGIHMLLVIIQLTEDGEYIKFFTPAAYHIPDDETAYAVLKTFSIIAWQVKLVDFEVDPADGEVRPTIDFALEDGTLTTEQVRRCCKTLARVIDILHPYIKHALVHNEVHERLLHGNVREIFSEFAGFEQGDSTMDEFRQRLAELQAEVEEEVEELFSESEPPEEQPNPEKEDDPSDDEWI